MGMGEPRFVDIDGVRTRYFERGSGEPLVLFHGGHFGSKDNVDAADNWDLNFDAFAESFHVFAPDKLGQGYTDNPRSDAEYTMASVVQHAYGFLTRLALKGVHLVGHSRGGFLVTRLTLEHPELVKTLTIVDSGTTAPGEVQRGTLLANPPQPLLSNESLRWVTEQFSASAEHVSESWLAAREAIGRSPKYEEAIAKMRTLDQAQFLPRLAEQKRETLAWIRDRRLTTPTLVVWGRNDPSALLQNGLALYDLIASSAERAQMRIFNRAGHYSYREHPCDFVATVTSFARLS